MRILLLNVSSESLFYSQLVVPFGLASLAAYLSNKRDVIHGIDMNSAERKIPQRYLSVDSDLLQQIKTFEPDLVGMTAYSWNMHNVLFWAKVIKTAIPNTTICVGGNHASYIGTEILETCPDVDFVIRFEGEIPFKDLCDNLADRVGHFEQISNLTFRRGDTVVETSICELIRDMDSLPILDRHIFEPRDRTLLTHADIITARGCPFQCTFCNCNHYWGKRYRFFSSDRTIEELKQLKERYPRLHTVRFRDEALTISRKHCLELCEALDKENLGLQYQAQSRLDGLDEEVIAALARTGFNRVYIGLESGSKAVLSRLKKGIDIDLTPKIIQLLRKYKLPVRFSTITGTPGETMNEARETLDLLHNLDLNFDEFYLGNGLQIYPGTQDCEVFLKKFPDYRWLQKRDLADGYVQSRDRQGNPTCVMFYGAEYTYEELICEFDSQFRAKLESYGYASYRDLEREKSATVLAIDRLRDNPQFLITLKRLFKRIDAQGKPWMVHIFGILSDVIQPQLFDDPQLTNFRGLILPDEESRVGRVDIRQKLQETQTLLMTMSDAAAQETGMVIKVRYRWRFSGEMVLLESYLKSPDPTEILSDLEDGEFPDQLLSHADLSSRRILKYFIKRKLVPLLPRKLRVRLRTVASTLVHTVKRLRGSE